MSSSSNNAAQGGKWTYKAFFLSQTTSKLHADSSRSMDGLRHVAFLLKVSVRKGAGEETLLPSLETRGEDSGMTGEKAQLCDPLLPYTSLAPPAEGRQRPGARLHLPL